MSGVRVRGGRAPTLRGLWQWPLRSVPRAVGTLVVVLALAAVLGTLTAPRAAPDATRTAAAAPTPAAVLPTRLPAAVPPPLSPADAAAARRAAAGVGATPSGAAPSVPAPPATDPAATTDAEIAAVAGSWATAWLAGGPDQQAWLARLAPLTTEEFLGQLASADAGRVPQGTVTGAVVVGSRRPASAVATVPTSAGILQLTVITGAPSWQVADVDRV